MKKLRIYEVAWNSNGNQFSDYQTLQFGSFSKKGSKQNLIDCLNELNKRYSNVTEKNILWIEKSE